MKPNYSTLFALIAFVLLLLAAPRVYAQPKPKANKGNKTNKSNTASAVATPPPPATPISITGKVLDDDTGEGLPFASVMVINKNGKPEGTTTDADGVFQLDLDTHPDSLAASMVGYRTAAKFVQRDSAHVAFTYRLKSAAMDIKEVVIHAGENPANRIVRGIIRNKKLHDISRLDSYEYEEYAKTELDLHQIDKKLQNSTFMKPFAFVFKNIDSTTDEKPYIPAFLNESLMHVYHAKNAGPVKKVPLAQRTSGVDNPTVTDFVNSFQGEVNVYDNWITLMQKPFVSPFSVDGLGYYNYYILDSAVVAGTKLIKLKFGAKRRQEPTFYGDFWVAANSWAVQRVSMRMSSDVNINLVNRIIVYQEFAQTDGQWLPTKVKTIIDFAPTEETPGIIGRKSVSFKNYKVNSTESRDDYTKANPEMFNPDELRKDPKYWETIRHDSLSKNEKSVYRMVDSVKNVPIFKTYQNIIYTLSSGFWDFHKFELGNLYSCYNNNPVEGDRVRLALATGTDFSKQVKVMGYGAYGFNDKQFKWGGKFQINLQRYPQRTILGGGYRQDIDVQSANSEEQGQGSLLSGIFRRDIPQKLLYLDESKIFLERWWTQGWSTRLTLLHYYMDPFDNSDGAGGGLNFFYIDKPSGEIRTNVRTTEIIFKARYAYGEKFIDNTFTRINLGTKYPRVSFQYSAGLKGVIGSQYEYQKVSLALDHWFYVGPLGWTSYHVKVGKTFGTLPYLLLEVPPGNETFMYAPENFSLMNRFEFASDFYGSLRLDHHFDGFFFNHIPLLRKLKLREVATFRAYWGSLSAENQAANALNYVDKAHQQPLRAANGVPYMEVGVGVENIFKFVQFHWMWRINYLDNPEAPHFTPMLGLRFDF